MSATEQLETSERFPACPSSAEIDLIETKLRETADPEHRKAILSQFLGGLDPSIELADQAAALYAGDNS
jgi:hypothetical protein